MSEETEEISVSARPTASGENMTVLKLGGSVITDKTTPEVVDTDMLGSVTETIGSAFIQAESAHTTDHEQHAVDASEGAATQLNHNSNTEHGGLIIVHGGGSFGHHHAERHNITTTSGTTDAAAICEVHDAMQRLNGTVVEALHTVGVPAVPVHPLSVATRDSDSTLEIPISPFSQMLAQGFVPVTHGDIIIDSHSGTTILSGDEIVVTIAEKLTADRVGLCSTVAGVYDDNGKIIPEITDYESVAGVLGDADTTDVTGGMAGKVRTLLNLNVPAHIFEPTALNGFLTREDVGTTVN